MSIPVGVGAPSDISRELGSGQFVFRIYDDDASAFVTNTSTNAAVYFGYDNALVFNASYLIHPNATGYVSYILAPNCNYSTGSHYWKAGASTDDCYYAMNVTTNPSFNMTGQLRNVLTMPSYNSYHNVTEQIPVNFTTLSDCPSRSIENPVINATTYSIELSLDGNSWQACAASNSFAGSYNCIWNSTNKTEGAWDVRVNSSMNGQFYSNSTTYTDWFNMINWNASNTSLPSVTPTQGGWTRLYNYTMNVTDQEGDTVHCALYVSTDNQNTWAARGLSQVNGTPGIITNGTCFVELRDFSCADIDNGSNQKWFKWQVVNGNPNHAWNTTPVMGPMLNRSTVSAAIVEGSGYGFNRSSGNNQVRRLAVNVFDTENSSYVVNANVNFWVTNDSADYILEKTNATDSLGNATYWFNPNCTHTVGPQTWIAGVSDSCYIDVNTSSNYTISVTGDLWPTITSPSGGKYLRGINSTMIRGNVTDECMVPVSNAIVNFTTIHQDTLVERSCSAVNNETLGFYNCTVLISLAAHTTAA